MTSASQPAPSEPDRIPGDSIEDCICTVTEPDVFGNRDLIENEDCPCHGPARVYECCGIPGGCGGPCAAFPCWELTT